VTLAAILFTTPPVAESREPIGPYQACSGQSRGRRHWGVCCTAPLWWRARTANGRTRLFASCEAAQRFANRLNAESLARTPAHARGESDST
jgi:hypothetical protein